MDLNSRHRDILNALIRLNGLSISAVATRCGFQRGQLTVFLKNKVKGALSEHRIEIALASVGWVAGRLDTAVVHEWRFIPELRQILEKTLCVAQWNSVPLFSGPNDVLDHMGLALLWVDGARVLLRAAADGSDLDAMTDFLEVARKPSRPTRPKKRPFYSESVIVNSEVTWKRVLAKELTPGVYDEIARGGAASLEGSREVPEEWWEHMEIAKAAGYTSGALQRLIERDLDIQAVTAPDFEERLVQSMLKRQGRKIGKREENAIRKAAALETRRRRKAGAEFLQAAHKQMLEASGKG